MDEYDDDENSFSHNEMKKRVGMTMDDTQTTFDGVASMLIELFSVHETVRKSIEWNEDKIVL